ncbi:MAG: hypothetical protein L3J12_03290 [Spirochaetales bacterium]|nr:hypothetical protein [Spirochaetales bacterium]
MNDRVVVVISTSDAEKAKAGLMYAVNSVTQGWMKKVELIFFGPAQSLLLSDIEIKDYVIQFKEAKGKVTACKFIAEQDENVKEIASLGVDVEYVGSMISDLIKEGYTPLIW